MESPQFNESPVYGTPTSITQSKDPNRATKGIEKIMRNHDDDRTQHAQQTEDLRPRYAQDKTQVPQG